MGDWKGILRLLWLQSDIVSDCFKSRVDDKFQSYFFGGSSILGYLIFTHPSNVKWPALCTIALLQKGHCPTRCFHADRLVTFWIKMMDVASAIACRYGQVPWSLHHLKMFAFITILNQWNPRQARSCCEFANRPQRSMYIIQVRTSMDKYGQVWTNTKTGLIKNYL